MPEIDTRGGRIHYAERGEGSPIVLLHATLHDHHDYDAIVGDLATDHRTIAVDWPSHGGSGTVEAPTAALFADVLEDVVDGLGLEPAIVIGNSVGGFAAARLAITRPERVAALVLVNTGGFLSHRNPTLRMTAKAFGTPAITRRVFGTFVRSYLQAGNEHSRAVRTRALQHAASPEGVRVATSLWRSFATPAHDLRSRAAAITAPTLIVWGSRDTAVPLPFGHLTRHAIPHAQFATLPTGHVPFATLPEQFLDIVRPFIAGLRPD